MEKNVRKSVKAVNGDIIISGILSPLADRVGASCIGYFFTGDQFGQIGHTGGNKSPSL